MLADFRTANYDAPEIQVIREALLEHITKRLKEPEMKRRYDKARTQRLDKEGKIPKLVSVKDE